MHMNSAASVERKQLGDAVGSLNTAEDDMGHLEKLRADSLLSVADKANIAGPVVMKETIIAGPAAAGLSSTGLFLGAALAKAALTEQDIEAAIELKQFKKESELIKREFSSKLDADKISAIEKNCAPSPRRLAFTLGSRILEETAWGVGSGLVLAPETLGWTLPVYTGAGFVSGVANGMIHLARSQKQCEVESFRREIAPKPKGISK
ncbi:MAG: hypothetical protein HY986_06280 [Candidatus Melainabacteria bacterium]|nr:hypothetical protein [Candidatus Melainabacteria bacterium]